MAHRFRKVGVAAVGVVAVILVAVALLSEKSPPASAPLPNPNGYDDFVRAGAMMDQRDYSAFPSLEKDGLASLVASNEEALAAARIGFTHACAVRGSALSLSPGSTSDMMVMKQIAQLFAAEGRLAEMEDRPADAARSYIDAVRLGNESSRGGLLIHRLVGVACQAIGLKRLAQVVPALNCDQSRPPSQGSQGLMVRASVGMRSRGMNAHSCDIRSQAIGIPSDSLWIGGRGENS